MEDSWNVLDQRYLFTCARGERQKKLDMPNFCQRSRHMYDYTSGGSQAHTQRPGQMSDNVCHMHNSRLIFMPFPLDKHLTKIYHSSQRLILNVLIVRRDWVKIYFDLS